ncbi:single-stranded DNA-binding protein [Psychrobium sp. 1_MG-2023]|uniref:single-stranded DNA-binding protein n=1 Tax=Psychrobium sp. 1_MG-2023 TaxID=3062624 RepID=UPI0026D885A6|nr:single-stranded DNA-binding protein [Psychrobium sp. 1_MG-2023]MDP2561677.1 single-stranded DNA-binding protein [Psychrobium sp. 1_MG-2023]
MQAHDNHIVLLGNIVSKQNLLKYYADGTASLTLDVITKRKWRDQQGQWQESSSYFNVTVLGECAEQLAQGANAGQGIYIRAAIRQRTNKQGVNNDTLEVLQAYLTKKSTALNWNQAHVCGGLVSQSGLVQTINGIDLITVVIDIAEQADKSIPIEVKLKGAAAKLVANQLEELADGQTVRLLVEGSLSGQSKKINEQFVYQYWIEGHTCLVIAD